MIAVIDYGAGNMRSVVKAIEHVAPQEQIILTNDPMDVSIADRVVLPGQGSMAGCMGSLSKNNLIEAVLDAALNKPFLGICLGLQALFQTSDEGGVGCLSLWSGGVKRFTSVKVPHIGWNNVYQTKPHVLWEGIPNKSQFYFAHSYYAVPTEHGDITGTTMHGEQFASAVTFENVFAVQFHPEKSAAAGLKLLSNFMKWNP